MVLKTIREAAQYITEYEPIFLYLFAKQHRLSIENNLKKAKCELKKNKIRIPVDNNLAERAVKPFVIGRNSWLFPHCRKNPNSTGECYRCQRFEKFISSERCFSMKNKAKSSEELVRENTDLKAKVEELKRQLAVLKEWFL